MFFLIPITYTFVRNSHFPLLFLSTAKSSQKVSASIGSNNTSINNTIAFSLHIAKRKEYLDRQLKNILDKSAKTEAEHQREQLLVDQCVFLTEEQEYVMVRIKYNLGIFF